MGGLGLVVFILVLAVVTFPIGLLVLLLARETLVITISLTATADGTHVRDIGQANKGVALGLGVALERCRGVGDHVTPVPGHPA